MTTPSIDRIRTVRVSLSPATEFTVFGSGGAHDQSDYLLIELTDSDARIGYGEVSATPAWSGEDAWSAEHFVKDLLAPALISQPIDIPQALDTRLDRLLEGNHFTKAGISIALWDLYARYLDVPLAQALGGVVREQFAIKCSLSGTPEHVEQAYSYATSLGFESFKVKVGRGGVGADLARFDQARQLAGDGALIGVDANTGWSREEATEAIPALAKRGVAFVEQPIAARDHQGLRALRSYGRPIVADESVGDIWDLRQVIAAEAADVASIYVGMSGGPAKAVAMAALATESGLEVVIGSNGEMGIGAAAQLHVAAASPAISTSIPSDIIGAFYYDEDILETPLDTDGKTVRLTRQPGLGVVPRADLRAQFK